MNVTKDVITDLLPLYLSGEASADTRTLVDEYLRSDPALARVAAAGPLALGAQPPRLAPDLELRALVRTRKLLKLRGFLVGAGMFFTLLPFAFVASDGHMRWAWSRAPHLAMVFAFVAACVWAGYGVMRRRLRTTGL